MCEEENIEGAIMKQDVKTRQKLIMRGGAEKGRKERIGKK